MNQHVKTKPEDITGVVLARLGREVMGPLAELITEVHAFDERASSNEDDETSAHLVELGHRLQSVLEPVIALARLEATPASKKKADMELGSALEEILASPDLAASFQPEMLGELGTSFVDRARFEQGVSLCLRLLARMTGSKATLRVHREVAAASERIVMAVPVPRPEPVALELLNRAVAHLRGVHRVGGSCTAVLFSGVGQPGRGSRWTGKAAAAGARVSAR